jgi:hypothetical protein
LVFFGFGFGSHASITGSSSNEPALNSMHGNNEKNEKKKSSKNKF